MPPRGRPPQPGTAEEKAAIRREKVRLYVKAHRERKKNTTSIQIPTPPDSRTSNSPPASDGEKETFLRREHSNDHVLSDNDDSRPVSFVLDGNIGIQSNRSIVTRDLRGDRFQNPGFSHAPGGNKELALALMGTFRGQFLPRAVCVPAKEAFGSELVTPCSAWITNAYTIAIQQDSGALKSCILAVGLALTAMQKQEERLKMMSLDVYRRALRQVRQDLKPLTDGRTTNYLVPYLSCLAAAMFELVHDGFSENIMQHVKGATSLMELLPRDTSVNHLLNDLLLEDLCMWEIVFALKYRYPSPLRRLRQAKGQRRYQIDGDALALSQNATILGDLLDGADEISTIMSCLDGLHHLPSSDAKRSLLQLELAKLGRIVDDLDLWAYRFHGRFGPIYTCVESNGRPEELAVCFASYEIAAAWVYCLTFQLCAFETSIQALTELLHTCQLQPSSVGSFSDVLPSRTAQQDALHQSFVHEPGSTSKGRDGLHPAPSFPDAKIEFWRERLDELRSRLRSSTVQLVQAICAFVPIPKGIIGQSLVLFPMDRAKAMLKKEMSRLSNDSTEVETDRSERTIQISQELEKLAQAMAIYESLEQTLLQFGMPPMPED